MTKKGTKTGASPIPLGGTWIEKKCDVCNKTFYIPPWRGEQRFCSHECADKLHLGGSIPNQVTKECAYCGDEFTLSYWQAKNRKYCSSECANNAQRGQKGTTQLKGKESPHYRGERLRHNGVWDYDIEGNYRPVHRMVMEEHLGRKLDDSEIVHHIDGDNTNNNVDNLYICSKGKHSELHLNLIKLIKPLISVGIVKFNMEKGEYYIGDKNVRR